MRPLVLLAIGSAAVAAAGCAIPPADVPPGAGGGVPRHRGPGARLAEPAPGSEATAPLPPGEKRLTLFPRGGLLYDPYLAAPRQSRTAVKLQFPLGDGSNVRIENTIGGVTSLARWTTEAEPDSGTEVQVEAAVFARFDLHERYDFEASDWRFGFPIVRREGDLAWKLHLYHMTSHLGDEYMERTGARPIDYHLEAAAAGLSWDASDGGRIYGEAEAAIYTGGPTGSGRFQVGYEWVGRKWSTGLSPFFAVDVQARKEQDWTLNKVVALGLAYGTHIRLGLEYYHGKDTQTQLMDERVRWLALGITLDI
jgi:hypothetical protein